ELGVAAADLLEEGPDVVALPRGLDDPGVGVAVEGDGDRGGGRAVPLDLAQGQGVGEEGEVVAAVGLDPEADLLAGGPVELDEDGDALGAGEAGGVHAGDDGGLLAGL